MYVAYSIYEFKIVKGYRNKERNRTDRLAEPVCAKRSR
jgi:hypothetical protein